MLFANLTFSNEDIHKYTLVLMLFINTLNPYDPDDVMVLLKKNLDQGLVDVTMLSLDKMAVGWVTRTWHHEQRPG